MRVLVSAGSKYGATTEIAETIAGVLRRHGADVTVAAPDDVRDIEGYDAVVLGSAVYMGHWLGPARGLIARHHAALGARAVWLFSSGPIGDPAMPKDEAVDIADIVRVTAARGHRTFAGKLVRGQLAFMEKAMVTALRAQEGDFRDWPDVEEWATTIAEELMSPNAALHIVSATDPALAGQEGVPS